MTPKGWAFTGLAAMGAALLAIAPPTEQSWYPRCPLFVMTGLYCPGCGTTRALSELATADVAGAFARNPLVPIALALLAVLFVRRAVIDRRSGSQSALVPDEWLGRKWVLWTIFGAIVVFTVLRNVPGMTWLSPV